MSEIKHTPWRVSLTDEITVVDSENNDVMTVSGEYETEYEEMAKRARLIAAAPELLEVLMLVEDRFGAHCIDPLPLDLCERISAAIAKAEGKS